jgi:serine phosphatase RsbU (regulator of sigma subunit)
MSRFLSACSLLASVGILVICAFHGRTGVALIVGTHCIALALITWCIFRDRRPKPRIAPFLLLMFLTWPVLEWSLGGIIGSGGIIIWSLIAPLTAGFVKGRLFITRLFLFFAALLVLSVALELFNAPWGRADTRIATALFLMNIVGISIISFLSLVSFFHYVRDIQRIMQEQTQNISSSIRYAQSIQHASLPSRSNLTASLGEMILFHSPKDIVSGDFYWTAHKNGRTVVAVADCTGHGVPGGFMTMLGINSLNNIVMEKGITDPAMILHYLHWSIRDSFSRSSSPVTDGMDISICSIDRANRIVTYSGAMSSLYHMNGALTVYPSGHMSIGEPGGDIDFSDLRIPLHEGDQFYMSSDGFMDQFGGEKDKRYGRKRMQELLVRLAGEPMARQQEMVEHEFNSWKGGREQIDDVLLLGFKM